MGNSSELLELSAPLPWGKTGVTICSYITAKCSYITANVAILLQNVAILLQNVAILLQK
jgi:hypothetical protein